ncbi:MAG TPA: rhamnulokinase family protein [Actinomycetes bacterium]|nr:rhamnulokinase family protein [Actinomycetes bacterium]
MTKPASYAAIDLGAASGRVVVGHVDEHRVALEEVHRFPNVAVTTPDGVLWDVLSLWRGVLDGLAKVDPDRELRGVGVDGWGVDYGLLDGEGRLLANPHSYRDPRTRDLVEQALGVIPADELYRLTGVQPQPINTLYQLLAERGLARLEAARTLLFIPDLIAYWLTGEPMVEATVASTSQLYDTGTGDWAWPVIERYRLPGHIFTPVVEPGAARGALLTQVAEATGVPARVGVTAVASHDTASAVAAVPAENDGFAYVSSGTWSLVGVETAGPVRTQAARAAGLTNELGVASTNRLLKNTTGLWLLQECRRVWSQQGDHRDYGELAAAAAAAPAFGPLVDPDDESFAGAADMPSSIRSFCARTGQRPPSDHGAMVRCILESLACACRLVLDQIEAVADRKIEVVHVVGGGARNRLLCQLTADAAGRPVLAGPVEATSLGNILVQAFGSDMSLTELRELVRRSIGPRRYAPRDPEAWSDALDRFERILQ